VAILEALQGALAAWSNKLFDKPLKAILILLVLGGLTAAMIAEIARIANPIDTVVISPFERCN